MTEDERMTLTEFLLARIDEDEREARASKQANDANADYLGPTDLDVSGWWNDQRVLAECDAKRRIIEGWGPFETYNGDALLRLLAAPFSDHPDFDPSWRPQ